MNLQSRAHSLIFYYTNGKGIRSAERQYCGQQKLKNGCNRSKGQYLRRLVNKFEKHSSINNLPKSGRGDAIENEDVLSV